MSDPSRHDRIVRRLFDQLYNRPIIDNVDRGVYVEYMVELALQETDARWECMPGWSLWDLEHRDSGARIEVKQSAKRQTWSSYLQSAVSAPRFSIAPTKWYWDNATGIWFETEPQRWADLYIFAYHPKDNEDIADHRRTEQWEFYLVPELDLPRSQKRIGLNPVRKIGSRCRFEELAGNVTRVISNLPRLKADPPPV
ncbi:MAG: hypothetical protein F4194_04620 [Acidimicrobiia bacterium]|nr:hypothetical protein [Acidimicrobiia bacterium]MYH05752.1 hypothetical protein [Acidimicrobiia bacterium]MYK54996.1 hypothetical protein [Acidimicrobiia bacterium]